MACERHRRHVTSDDNNDCADKNENISLNIPPSNGHSRADDGV
jgi:hypothetical protein